VDTVPGMSPVSRRRSGAGRPRPVADTLSAKLRAQEARRIRGEQPLDALTSRIGRLDGVVDGFKVEAVASYVLEVVASRGPDSDEMLARFSRAAVSDPRAASTSLGVCALAALSLHGHREVREECAQLVAAADPSLVPAWVPSLGQVSVVETGVLRNAEATETLVHVMLDHVEPAAGPRHMLSMHVDHAEQRVHVLDVRVRKADDSLAPMAEHYAGSTDPVWSWGSADDVRAAADPAVRTTALQPPSRWPVTGVEGGETLMWLLGVHRLEQITGTSLL
jgi:hypothetical protein